MSTRPPEGSPEEIFWLRGYEAGVVQARAEFRDEVERLRAELAIWRDDDGLTTAYLAGAYDAKRNANDKER